MGVKAFLAGEAVICRRASRVSRRLRPPRMRDFSLVDRATSRGKAATMPLWPISRGCGVNALVSWSTPALHFSGVS